MILGLVIIAFQAEILILLAYWRTQVRLQLEINQKLIETNDDLIAHLGANDDRLNSLSRIEQAHEKSIHLYHQTVLDLMKDKKQ